MIIETISRNENARAYANSDQKSRIFSHVVFPVKCDNNVIIMHITMDMFAYFS